MAALTELVEELQKNNQKQEVPAGKDHSDEIEALQGQIIALESKIEEL